MAGKKKYDCAGWVTKNDIRCSDGRTIRKDAFKHCDGLSVPLVWMHSHDDPTNVIGNVLLENRPNGVYGYASFNDTDKGRHSKELVQHGDIKFFSIYANHLKQSQYGDVMHGDIKEVSIVISPANIGAAIEFPILEHGEEAVDEGIIYTGEEIDLMFENELEHAEGSAPAKEKTVADVFNELTDEQKNVVYFLIGQAVEDAGGEDEEVEHSDFYDEGESVMKRNVFENGATRANTLSHSDVKAIFTAAQQCGSLRDAVRSYMSSYIQHDDDVDPDPDPEPTPSGAGYDYGIRDIDILFPDARALDNEPQMLKRQDEWVAEVLNAVHKSPFSRVKTTFADVRDDEARAKGYAEKGKLKKEEVIKLSKRVTQPTTIYKKQKLDRDDILDITDFNVVAWIKAEMRMMLNEELARAILFGDGRQEGDEDKIDEDCIRPIISMESLFKMDLTINESQGADPIEDQILLKMNDYEGSGTPVMYTTRDFVTKMMLRRDTTGRKIYGSESELATAMGVSKFVKVDKNVMPSDLYGVIVNLKDYNVGADKGGEINFFDDFDIDYNQYKYLYETRCSGSLTKAYSAIVVKKASNQQPNG